MLIQALQWGQWCHLGQLRSSSRFPEWGSGLCLCCLLSSGTLALYALLLLVICHLALSLPDIKTYHRKQETPELLEKL